MRGVTQLGLAAGLAARMEKSGPITIGLAGAGQMGTDIVVEVALMPGVRIGAISEVRAQAARDAALLAGHSADDIVNASSASDIDRAIEIDDAPSADAKRAINAAGAGLDNGRFGDAEFPHPSQNTHAIKVRHDKIEHENVHCIGSI